jgi:hypothetical protein
MTEKRKIGTVVRVAARKTMASSLVAGFAHGLSQMGSFGTAGALVDYPTPSKDAIRGDWQRVGGDLKRGFDKVRASEKTKAKA